MSDRELLTECLDVLTHDAAQRTFAGGVRMSQLAIKLRAHLAAPRPEPVRHPGYVIGNHWLETAYSRICAGEAEANVLRDYGLIREEAFTIGVEHLRQENERLHQINWSHEMKLSVRGYEMQIDSLKADNERLREALKKYGRHLDDCALTLGGYQCTCGFNQQEVPR